jgi:hypothetical protein
MEIDVNVMDMDIDNYNVNNIYKGRGQQAIVLPLFLIMSIAVLNTVERITRPILPVEAYFSVNLALASFLTMFPENKTGTGSALCHMIYH